MTSPGSSCHPQLTNSVTLPPATGTGTISYAIANLPPGVMLDDTTGVLTGAIETVTAPGRQNLHLHRHGHRRQPDGLPHLHPRSPWTRRPYCRPSTTRPMVPTGRDKAASAQWQSPSSWVDIALPTTCLDDLEGVSLHRIADPRSRYSRAGVEPGSSPDNNLTGRLPAELGKLTNLTEIHNQAPRPLPRSLQDLPPGRFETSPAPTPGLKESKRLI